MDMNQTLSKQTVIFRSIKVPAKVQASPSALRNKRVFDILFSLAVITLLLSWLLPILALLIKLSSRGPVFFIQKRIGQHGKAFRCIKLRTMVVNAQANHTQATKNDPRITPLGKFLRLSCLDELPQFFNVLAGSMSVVGPRPHMLNDCKEFKKHIHNYDDRNCVKPGITGMAQVKGYRGMTVDYFDVFHRYKWDMFYVRNVSFKLDMRIIRLTITSTLASLVKKESKPLESATELGFDLRPKVA